MGNLQQKPKLGSAAKLTLSAISTPLKARLLEGAMSSVEAAYTILDKDDGVTPDLSSLMAAATQARQAAQELDTLAGIIMLELDLKGVMK